MKPTKQLLIEMSHDINNHLFNEALLLGDSNTMDDFFERGKIAIPCHNCLKYHFRFIPDKYSSIKMDMADIENGRLQRRDQWESDNIEVLHELVSRQCVEENGIINER